MVPLSPRFKADPAALTLPLSLSRRTTPRRSPEPATFRDTLQGGDLLDDTSLSLGESNVALALVRNKLNRNFPAPGLLLLALLVLIVFVCPAARVFSRCGRGRCPPSSAPTPAPLPTSSSGAPTSAVRRCTSCRSRAGPVDVCPAACAAPGKQRLLAQRRNTGGRADLLLPVSSHASEVARPGCAVACLPPLLQLDFRSGAPSSGSVGWCGPSRLAGCLGRSSGPRTRLHCSPVRRFPRVPARLARSPFPRGVPPGGPR